MLKIRTACLEDAQLLSSHNCAMAMETEDKILDPVASLAGVEGLFERTQFGFYLVAEVDSVPAATLMVTMNGPTGAMGCSGGFSRSM